MKLTHSCIVTNDVKKLAEFYQDVLQVKAIFYGGDYAEFEVGQNILAIFDIKAHDRLAPNSAKAGLNQSVILEFNVENVDKEYERLREMNIDWVKEPTIQPWGNKSIYFSDLDGNMLSFYTQI